MTKTRKPRVPKKAPKQSTPQKAMEKAPQPAKPERNYEAELKGKDAIISGKNAEIEALKEELAKAKLKVKSAQTKDATISKLRTSNTKLKEENIALTSEVKARDNNTTSLEQDVKHFKDIADNLRSQITNGNIRITEFADRGFFSRAFTSREEIKATLRV